MLRGLICLLFASLLPINFVQAAPLVEKSFYPKFDAGSTAPEAVTGAIEALVHEHARRWTPKVWRSTLELWDRSEPAPYILLVHQPDWLIGWEQIDGYFAKKPNLPVKEIPDQAPAGMQQIEKIHYEYRSEWEMRAMQYTPSGIRVRLIDKDLAMAVWYVDFQYKPSFMPARGEEFKANAMFRYTDSGWKFIHYGEAAMSPIMYLERLYRTRATPEFIEKTSLKKRRAK